LARVAAQDEGFGEGGKLETAERFEDLLRLNPRMVAGEEQLVGAGKVLSPRCA